MINLLGLFLTLFLGSGILPVAVSPSDIVAEFCTLDIQGARLHSVESDPIWKLTVDDGEPPVSPIAIVDSFRIIKSSSTSNQAVVKVEFKVQGFIDSQQVFHSSRQRIQSNEFMLLNESGWKISLKNLHASPHVRLDAYIQHLDTLILAIGMSDHKVERTKLQRLKTQLIALKSAPYPPN